MSGSKRWHHTALFKTCNCIVRVTYHTPRPATPPSGGQRGTALKHEATAGSWLLVGSAAPQEPYRQGISWLCLLMLSKANVYSREEATHWVILQALLVFSVSLKSQQQPDRTVPALGCGTRTSNTAPSITSWEWSGSVPPSVPLNELAADETYAK